MEERKLIEIASLFLNKRMVIGAIPFGGGHINDTFLIKVSQSRQEFILQKINKDVFKTPLHVAHNIERYLNHLHQKKEDQLLLYTQENGLSYFIDENDDYWRMYNRVANAVSFEVIEKTEHAYEAAKAFGKMQRLCIDLNPMDFYDTIPDFHDLHKRYEKFDKTLACGDKNRLFKAEKEIEFALDQQIISEEISSLLKTGGIPIRITHNDTKLNNVLLDQNTGKGICVIDLDTLMPGIVLYDFGDMVRTFTSPVAEDEKDVSKVMLRHDVFEALTKGYLSELSVLLTKTEKQHLLTGAKYMILIIGLRFLTDYLQNDVYFKTKYEDHNLVRAKNQFALLKNLIDNESKLNSMISKYI